MSTAVKKVDENKFEVILDRIVKLEETGVSFPENYSPENAARSAWLILQDTKDMGKKPALEVCTPESVANAMLKMVTLGLNPLKDQCYFIVYGNKLECSTSYFGEIAIAKRHGIIDVNPVIIWKGDEFNYSTENGITKVISHNSKFENIGTEILGAYAVVKYPDGSENTEIMNMGQIRKSWEQGATKGNSPAHKNFPDQMCKKTVVNRAIKIFINSSDDSNLYLDNRQSHTQTEAYVKHKIEKEANKTELTMTEDIEHEEVKQEAPAGEMPDMFKKETAKAIDPGF